MAEGEPSGEAKRQKKYREARKAAHEALELQHDLMVLKQIEMDAAMARKDDVLRLIAQRCGKKPDTPFSQWAMPIIKDALA